MKPGTILRIIISVVVAVAFVLGATFAEASNSLNPTALWWAQRQLPLLWLIDSFALLALLPVFGSAILQTRLAHKSEEITQLRSQHETQMEDVVQHSEEVERINIQQSKSLEALEATVEALSARLNAMETDNRAHQANMEAEARRLAVDAFTTLAGEVQANTRQMEAVSLAMQYQRAEIQQLRQNVRATQRPLEISEVARLTPYELAALEGDAPPLLLEDGGEDGQGKEEIRDTRYEIREGEDSSFILHPSSLPVGFFEPTMNAGTTFVSPVTEFEITPPAFEEANSAAGPQQANTREDVPSNELLEAHNTESVPAAANDVASRVASPANDIAPPNTAVSLQEYRFLHGTLNGVALHREDFEVQTTPAQTHSEQSVEQPEPSQTDLPQTEAQLSDSQASESRSSEPEQANAPRGPRRWFMRP